MNRPAEIFYSRQFVPPARSLLSRRFYRGYVLLVTLGLLVVSTTLLVAVGRAAAAHALAAHTAQDELQQRWSAVSCRAAVLPYAEQILVSAEQRQRRPVANVQAIVPLGDGTMLLAISDEQAKANVNMMIDQFGVDGAEDRLRQAMTGTGIANHVRLRPAVLPDEGPPTTQPTSPTPLVFGPGQMFDAVSPESLLKITPGVDAPMQIVTCWGTGRLNVMRADETSMQAMLFPNLTRLQISRLIDARNKTVALPIDSPHPNSAPPGNLDSIGLLLAKSQIDAGVRNRLSLTTLSECHSLRMTLHGRRRTWHWLTVDDESVPKRPRTESIVW